MHARKPDDLSVPARPNPTMPLEAYPPGTFGAGTYFGQHGMVDILGMIRNRLQIEAVSFCRTDTTYILWRMGNTYVALSPTGITIPIMHGNVLKGAFILPPAIRVELCLPIDGDINSDENIEDYLREYNEQTIFNDDDRPAQVHSAPKLPYIRYSRMFGDAPAWSDSPHHTPIGSLRFILPVKPCRMLYRHGRYPDEIKDYPYVTVRILNRDLYGLYPTGEIINHTAAAAGSSRLRFGPGSGMYF